MARTRRFRSQRTTPTRSEAKIESAADGPTESGERGAIRNDFISCAARVEKCSRKGAGTRFAQGWCARCGKCGRRRWLILLLVGEITAKQAGRSWCSRETGCGERGKPGTQDARVHRVSLLSGFAQAS